MKLQRPLIYVTAALLFITNFVSAQEDDEIEIEDQEDHAVDAEVMDELNAEAQETSEEMLKEISTGIVDTSNYPGRIISRKKVVSKVPAAGQELEFEYTIWNVGNSDVVDVELVDNSYGSEEFEQSKTVTMKRAVIKPGESYSETHSVIPKMNEAAQIKLHPATVTYKTKTSNENDEIIEYTSDGATEGIVPIKTAAYYARNVASHYTDWLIFLALTVPSVYLPYVQAQGVVAKYNKAKSA